MTDNRPLTEEPSLAELDSRRGAVQPQQQPPLLGQQHYQGYPTLQGYQPVQPSAQNQGYPPSQNYNSQQAPPQPQMYQPPPQFMPVNQPYSYPYPPPAYSFPPVSQFSLNMPSHINPSHPSYAQILQVTGQPCASCGAVRTDYISSSIGCAAIGWATCLFCFTGILCCWVPLVLNDCKDIKINCARCGYCKRAIEKDCC